ncbi:hypothetical protein Tfer_3027 [Thermincola ferriacetica]|uniref:Putative gluconeogenesis factor n=1 Tax=Thermincola ferriacetica TaxID=281456 RepID=A0A0L6W055_9FIRM|nr:YvcK family protein [Thermincola ferriacetica]KNZ68449.1 hypothetical protein Tfer_3027 [Thermincola ferriacetica]
MYRLKWLYPGMYVKRWLFLACTGLAILGLGLTLTFYREFSYFTRYVYDILAGLFQGKVDIKYAGLWICAAGFFILALGFRKTIKSIARVLAPDKENRLVDIIYETHQLERGPRIVVIGGGTGLSVLLRGLKKYTRNITAIVTVADDGGSSGQLRGELGILPPGDIRNCLVALADRESLMEDLFQHRFKNANGLSGHSLGNLLIAGMTQIAGNFETAIQEMGKVLAIRGRVLPVTLKHVALCAEFMDGTVVEGESRIPRTGKKIKRVFLRPADCEPLPGALEAIAEADIIVLGPGSLYTSIIPNLLVRGVADAIAASPAVTVYACNIMTQPGETDGFSASEHVRAIQEHAGSNLIQYAIINVQDVPRKLLKKYREDGAVPVRPDIKEIEKLGVKVIPENLVFESDLVRHDPEKLARVVIKLAEKIQPARKHEIVQAAVSRSEPGKGVSTDQ